MKNLEYSFEVVEPDYPNAFVPEPQVLVFDLGNNTRRIEVHFMENSALAIVGSDISSGMGTLNLWYETERPGVLAASKNLRKVIYTFANSQGMARNVIFRGNRSR